MQNKEAETKKDTVKKTSAAKETVKETVKKATEKKAPAKKEPAKKSAAKKEIKIKTYVQYMGRQVEEKDMIAAVKKAWTKENKRKSEISKILRCILSRRTGLFTM